MKHVNLVLSGGGIRGLAHIGVLKVLEAEGIHIKSIAGSSAGALVGAFYASCKDAGEVERFARSISFYKLPDIRLSKLGLIKGEKIERTVEDFIRIKRFGNLKIPLCVNATDLQTGKERVFTSGDIMPALRASIAYPGVLTPKRIEGSLFADGGLVNPVPIDHVPKSGPVIISDVTMNLKNVKNNASIIDMMVQSVNILQKSIIDAKLATTTRKHVLIRPDTHEWDVFQFKNDERLITRGEEAARKALPKIKQLLK